MDIVEFASEDLGNKMSSLQPEEIDELPFGAIQVDSKGTITFYNATQDRAIGHSHDQVIGKNFFYDIAPCTNTMRFKGAFDKGVKSGKLSVMFEYVFTYRMKPTKVAIHLANDRRSSDRFWIFVRWRDQAPGALLSPDTPFVEGEETK